MRVLILAMIALVACSGPPPQVPEQAKAAIAALQAAQFEQATKLADEILSQYPQDAQSRVVRAIARYRSFGYDLSTDVRTLAGGMFLAQAINTDYLDFALKRAHEHLIAVEADLAQAVLYPEFSLPLCLACWEVDWNRNGRIDRSDRRLFEIEYDGNGQRLADDNPRRRPEFHFDHGDIYWARAMVAFQHAVINLLQAYDFSQLNRLTTIFMGRSEQLPTITFSLRDQAKVRSARDLILHGLDQADLTREAYLAETDDLNEWVPNPQQLSHPLPLPVDMRLFTTWEGAVEDLRAIVRGDEGISVEAAAQLGDHVWQDPPQGYINVGYLLEHPGAIVLDFNHMRSLDRNHERADVERVLTDIFGAGYQQKMAPTPLLERMQRMRGEVERGEESFERKLRYLLWLN